MKVRNGGWEVVDVKEDVEGDQLGHDAPVALPAEGEEDRSAVFPKGLQRIGDKCVHHPAIQSLFNKRFWPVSKNVSSLCLI